MTETIESKKGGAEIEILPLRPTDDRSEFSCGEAAIDRYFRHYAGQNQFKLKLATTYVALLKEHFAGFSTLSVGNIERHELPSEKERKRLPSYPLPILRLARLGVDERAQGSGIGRALIRHAFLLALNLRDLAGCVGVVVDSKPLAVEYYRKLGFVALSNVRAGAMHGGYTPMFLDIHTIALAVEDTDLK